MYFIIRFLFGLLFVYGILYLFSIKLKIYPYDSKDSCRTNSITYLDDMNKKYVYYKKHIDEDCFKTAIKYQDIQKKQNTECLYFIVILCIICVLLTAIFHAISNDLNESILLSLSILIFITFFPDNTLHAIDSNKWIDKYLKDNDGNLFSFQPIKI